MSLIGLPTEVLQNVIAHTMPKGFESFMLSCKKVFAAGEMFLEVHNDLRRQYRHFHYNNETRCSLQLLHRIAYQPLTAHYIEAADFFEDCGPEDGVQTLSDFLDDPKAAEAFIEMLSRSEYLRKAGLGAEEWLDGIIDEHSAKHLEVFQVTLNSNVPYTACLLTLFLVSISRDQNISVRVMVLPLMLCSSSTFLLSLLPNITNLTLPKSWYNFPRARSEFWQPPHRDPEVWRLLDVIATEASKGDDRPLSRLVKLHPFADPGYEERAGSQVLNPFMVLPSIRELSVISCIAVNDGYTGKPFDWRYDGVNSNAEKLELAYCTVAGDQLAGILKHTPNLRSFKLLYETKWHGCGYDWDVHKFIAALGEHCGSTLTELSVTVDTHYGTIKGGVTSLKAFKRLEHFELDVRFFFGPPVTDELRDMPPEEYRAQAYSAGWNASSIPSLVDMLPATIKTLRLVAGAEPEDPQVLRSLLVDFGARRDNDLPVLETAIVHRATSGLDGDSAALEQNSNAWAAVKQMVSLAGFEFIESTHVEASWLEDFRRRYPRRRWPV